MTRQYILGMKSFLENDEADQNLGHALHIGTQVGTLSFGFTLRYVLSLSRTSLCTSLEATHKLLTLGHAVTICHGQKNNLLALTLAIWW